jgi:hypothetical protein
VYVYNTIPSSCFACYMIWPWSLIISEVGLILFHGRFAIYMASFELIGSEQFPVNKPVGNIS